MPNLSLRTPEETLKELNEEQLKAIQKVYQNAYKNVKDKLKNFQSKTPSSELEKQELEKIKKNIHSEYKEVGGKIESLLKQGIEKASKVAVNVNVNWLKKVGINFKAAYSYVPKDIVESIVTGQIYKGNWSLSKAIWNDVEKNQKDIEQIIATGLAENKSSFDIAKDLEKYVNPKAKKDYDWSKVYPGTKKRIDYNALRLSKTLISHGYQQSYEKTVSKNPFVEGVKWEIANNHRVCDICKERAKQNKYGLGEGIYPKDKVPMDHPNGQCVLTSVIPPMTDVANRLVGWVNGKEDKALDNWAKDLTGNKVKSKAINFIKNKIKF